jgi:electron transfer flavoprotein-quinone oxidoreductase
MSSEEKFECIVVGAGPAGCAAAYALAKAGIEVLLVERGETPGSKNVTGGVLYTSPLNKLIPEFWKEAPVERPITRRRISYLSDNKEIAFEFGNSEFREPPNNNSFSILRGKFDKWFSEKAEEAGAMVIPETTIDELIMQDGRCVGVKARREDGDMYSNVVIVAEGANSLLAKKAGLRSKFSPNGMMSSAKEVLELSSEKIEDRFCLEKNDGTAMQFFGNIFNGMLGGGFLYTNKETISIGVAMSIGDMIDKKGSPNDVLEAFKEHPSVKRFIKGAEMIEYSAHMIPEYGYSKMPQIVADGVILTGDAAGFVNTSLYHEGSNLAFMSGILAAETVIAAKEKGNYSKETLSMYKDKLDKSFVLKDLYRYRNFTGFLHQNPDFFTQYPELASKIINRYFTIDERPKQEAIKDIWQMIKRDVKFFKLIKQLNGARKALI